MGQQSRHWQSRVPFGDFRGESVSLPFPPSRCCLHSLACGSFIFKAGRLAPSALSLTLTLLLPSFTCNDLCYDIELIQTIQEINLESSQHPWLYHICKVLFASSSDIVTSSRNLDVDIWAGECGVVGVAYVTCRMNSAAPKNSF